MLAVHDLVEILLKISIYKKKKKTFCGNRFLTVLLPTIIVLRSADFGDLNKYVRWRFIRWVVGHGREFNVRQRKNLP